MRKKLQLWIGLIFFLFLLPIVADKIPAEAKEEVTIVEKKDQRLVYASNLRQIEPPPAVEEPAVQKKSALVYFTHYDEAFKPITQAHDGKIAVSHLEKNITNFGEQLKAHFQANNIQTDVLDVKVSRTKAYDAIRPHVKQMLAEKQYDLLLDIHRDALKKDRTTVQHEGASYAKIAIVIGQENNNYRWNEALAERISKRMNELIPDISRGLIPKQGHGVDGNYNQDLSRNLLLIEIGGIDNTEEEINRTIAVLSKAASDVLNAEQLAKD
ncbi:stage II sporulation protein P [Chungangia koreensis]|uniref:Stage II sporulation protein P n=1 Tax=Chungangia koreensis TaxID=752657 RepID=A0ABV8XAA1_9LACT